MTDPTAFPVDAHDRALLEVLRPPDHVAPTPRQPYQLVVVGGGTAGLVAAHGAAGLGARVALVERNLLGGDCLNVGCVPSKALLVAARAAARARGSDPLGVRVAGVEVDFPAVMARMREERAAIAPHDGVARLREAGIDVFLGEARFTGPDALEVDGQTLRFARAVLATGARAALPPIEGLDTIGALTNETVFDLERRPDRLVVLGAGPIGCELAQAFRRFGSEVVLVDRAPRVLPRDLPEAAAVVQAALEADGVELVLGAGVTRAWRDEDGRHVAVEGEGGARTITGDTVLVALGRRPNLDGLGLEAAGIARDDRGALVLDDRLRTTNAHVFASGDVTGRFAFTHAADASSRLVLQNALFFPTKSADGLVVPWATYTDPELAHVGPAPDALASRRDLTTVEVSLDGLDRFRLEGHREGFARAWVDGRGRVVAATVVGAHAGDLIAGLTVAVTQRARLSSFAGVILPYPTHAEILKRLGDAYNKTRFTPTLARWSRRWLRWALG